MFSFHGLDIHDAIEASIKRKEITKNAAAYAIEGMYKAMHTLSQRYASNVLTVDTWKRIEGILEDIANIPYSNSIVNTGFSPLVQNIDQGMLKALESKFNELSTLFKKPYLVTYQEGTTDRLPSIKILHNSFSNLRDIVNKEIKKQILETLKENGVTNSKLLDSNFITTVILNWGHTRTGDSLITGKLLASLIAISR
jgi:hypothetical protein